MSDGDEGRRVTIQVANGVADVRLNRPDKMNALDPAMFREIAAAGEGLRTMPGLRAVVLSGEGRAFCAGLDMASFAATAEGRDGLPADIRARTHGDVNLFQHVATVWRRLPVPVVAAIAGVAYGGGLQIALGADIRIVTPDAKLSVMEIRWGIVPDMGGNWLLRGLVRADVARELTFTGRVVSGDEAVAIGLATRTASDPLAAAQTLAREIAGQSPDAVRAAKRLLGQADDSFADAILAAESDEQVRLIGSPNQIEAVRANLAKRPPVFRDPA